MNIQPTSYTKNHLLNNNGSNVHLSQDELSIKKRREDLSRRPSYRKIFNDLTGLSGPALPENPPPPPPPLQQQQQQQTSSPPSLAASQSTATSLAPLGAHLAPPTGAVVTNPAILSASAAPNRHSPQLHRPPTASPSPIQNVDLLHPLNRPIPVGVVVEAGNQAATIVGKISQSPNSVVDIQSANTNTSSATSAPTQLQQLQQHSTTSNHHQSLEQQIQRPPSHHLSPTDHLQASGTPDLHLHQPHHLQHHQHQHHQQQLHHLNHQQQHQQLSHHHHQQQQQQQQQHHHHHQQQQQQQQQQQRHQHHQQPQHQLQQQQQLTHIHHLQTSTSPPLTGNGVVVGEEANKKRELRLQKNREAAKECRRKKKEYIKCLENRVAVLENQNKALIDELKTLKDLYCKTTTE